MGYFANTSVAPNMYWYLNEKQLALLTNIQQKQPDYGSLSFPTTGYFIMREGWESSDKMLIISAGLDKDKPDHQHGDMLGIQAMANGKVILPNYQVRYSLEDYEFFKNSLVKNVALVDNELQGKDYKSNQGGSGFGKFGLLPQPTVIAWDTNPNFDFFVGGHNGFENIGVNYTRQVINISNDFWIVKDNFNSEKPHTYKQVWQGHYTFEHAPNLLRATFDDATGCDIYQLQKIDTIASSGTRGKQWTIATKDKVQNFSFVTVVFPYKGFDNRILETEKNPTLKGWEVNDSSIKIEGIEPISLSKNTESYFFNVQNIELNTAEIELVEVGDIYVNSSETEFYIQSLSTVNIELTIKNSPNCNTTIVLQPGEKYKCEL
jgi:hypothetical protein